MTDTTLAAPAAAAPPSQHAGQPGPLTPAETLETAPAPNVSGFGDPFALGLASFGISALVLSTVMSGMIDATSTAAVLSLALAVGFLVEIIAGVIHFARGETFAGMVFTAYAGFWLSYALLVQFYGPQVVAAGGDPAAITGMFLLAWGIFSTYMLLAALKTNLTTIAIFTVLSAVFYLAAIGAFAGSAGLGHLAGYLLVLDAALALYASAALVVNGTWDRAVLPVP